MSTKQKLFEDLGLKERKTLRLHVRIDFELQKQFEERCKQLKVTKSAVIEALLKKFLSNDWM